MEKLVEVEVKLTLKVHEVRKLQKVEVEVELQEVELQEVELHLAEEEGLSHPMSIIKFPILLLLLTKIRQKNNRNRIHH